MNVHMIAGWTAHKRDETYSKCLYRSAFGSLTDYADKPEHRPLNGALHLTLRGGNMRGWPGGAPVGKAIRISSALAGQALTG